MNTVASFQLMTAPPPLAHDLALPQRDLLLDESEVARRLSRLLAATGPIVVDKCERQRTKYRIGESLRVLYRIRANGSWHLLAARTPARSSVHATSTTHSGLRSLAYDAETSTVFRLYPHDRKIETLNAFEQIPRALSRIGAATWVRSELVGYTPEKCATSKCLDDDGAVIGYAKIYGGGEGRQVFEKYGALAATQLSSHKEDQFFANAILYSDRFRLLLLEAVAGTRVADLCGDDLRRAFHNLGRTLAAFHQRPVPQTLPRFTRLDLNRISKAATLVSRARPDVGDLARRLSIRLCSGFRQTAVLVCLHGDVHPKNGIAQNGKVTLIDLDQVGVGPAAADLGSLLAALRYNRCVGLISVASERVLTESFLLGYSEVNLLPDDHSLQWHMAAALLAERALRSVNRIRPEGLLHLRTLLSQAHEVLRGKEIYI